MKALILGGDFKDIRSIAELKDRIAEEYRTTRRGLNKFEFLIAYQDTGSWGCDSSSFFLMRDKDTGKYFEVHGGHCSCYGFEDQWAPEETVLARYLERDWYFPAGGYDEDSETNRRLVLDRIRALADVPAQTMRERAAELADRLYEDQFAPNASLVRETITLLRDVAKAA